MVFGVVMNCLIRLNRRFIELMKYTFPLSSNNEKCEDE